MGSVWRTHGKRFATVVVKVTIGFTDDGTGFLLTPGESPLGRDTFRDSNPTHSLLDCADNAPFLESGEVLFRGTAQSGATAASRCRFAVVGREGSLMERTFIVLSGTPVDVPLTCENTIGGPGNKDNPVGSLEPRILDALEPSEPAIFGPIARTWWARKRLLAGDDAQRMSQREPEFRDGFEWAYFRAAPKPQRLETGKFFEGNETIVIEGMPSIGRRRVWRLPSARPEAVWVRRDSASVPIAMRRDLLRIDADRGTVALSARGCFALDDSADRMVIAAGVGISGRPVQWPEIQMAPDEDLMKQAAVRAKPALDSTGILQLDGLLTPTLPFAKSDAAREAVARALANVSHPPRSGDARETLPLPDRGDGTDHKAAGVSEPPAEITDDVPAKS